MNGLDLAIYDHELAFFTEGIIGWRPPWQPGAISNTGSHVFFQSICGQNHDFRRLRGAWSAVSDSRLQEYQQALPPEWYDEGEGVGGDALNYIAQVRSNIDPALAEIERVLA